MALKEGEKISRSPTIGIEAPSFYDWIALAQKMPVTLWNYSLVYGKELDESYRPNLTTSLIIEYWREITGVSAKDIEKSGLYNSLGIMRALIKKYDAFIDSSGSLNSQFSMPDFKQEEFLDTASDLVTAIDAIDIPRKKKQELCRKICQFRREQLSALNSQRNISLESLSLNQATRIREKSSGQIGLLLVKILNAPFNIPDEMKKKIESSFYHFCVVGQVIDDVADCQIDWEGNHPNIFLSTLNENPEEKLKFGDWLKQKRKIFTFDQLAKIAPQSSKMVEEYIHEVSSLIPYPQMRGAIRCALYFPHGIIR